MKILVYLAALAIFLFIVNLGAQWLGADDESTLPAASTERATAPSVTQPQPEQASTETLAAMATGTDSKTARETQERIDTVLDETMTEPLHAADTAVPPSNGAATAPTASAERAQPADDSQLANTPPSDGQESGGRELSAQVTQTPAQKASVTSADAPTAAQANPASTANTPPHTKTEPASEPAVPTVALQASEPRADPVPAASQPAVSAAAEESVANSDSAIERFASNAANVAEDAVESVSNTIKSVSSVLSGDGGDGLDQPLVPDSIAALMRRHAGEELLVLFWHPEDETVTESFEWLGQMQTRYGSQGMATVAVNLASDLDRSSEPHLAHGSNIEQRSDPERILARAFWVQKVPSVYLLAANGALLRRIEGFDQAQTGSYEDSVRLAVRR